MPIIHGFDQSGGFIAADTDTGRSAYAYVTSSAATRAKRNPDKVAADLMRVENQFAASWRDVPQYRDRDARWIACLQSR